MPQEGQRPCLTLIACAALLAAPASVSPASSPSPGSQAAAPCAFGFAEVSGELGVDFRHRSGASGDKHLPETMGSGVAWFDYDGDGWLDLLMMQSGEFPPRQTELRGAGPGAAAAPADTQARAEDLEAGNRLWRNLGPVRDAGGGERFRFVEWTQRAGIGDRGYGQGVLPLDLDGDEHLDLLFANYGGDVVMRARGDGTYASEALDELATVPSDLPRWSSSAAAADADGDGDLDLYIARYLEYDPDHTLRCGGERQQVCDPALFEGADDAFWRNDGGRLVPLELAPLGLLPLGPAGKGLGVMWSDLDDDADPDLYVANDLTLNFLFRSRREAAAQPLAGAPASANAALFEDVSLLSGAAVNRAGRPEAGMGLGMGDFDADGDPELLVTNFDVETNTLYDNRGGLSFHDAASTSGFGLPSFNRLGFGLVVADFDLDGRLDVYVANGHIFDQPERSNVGFAQPDQLLRGSGGLRLQEIGCVDLGEDLVSRGAAGGDFDNDGDVDLAVNHLDGPARVLRNLRQGAIGEARAEDTADADAQEPASWLGLELAAAGGNNTQGIGADVRLTHGGPLQRRWVTAGDSYQSSSDRRLLFALSPAAPSEPAVLQVAWPDGSRQRVVVPAHFGGRYLRLVQP